jgi:transcriptional regulator with XRE-family HTH domain
MKFPNLLWAIAQVGRRYKFAARMGVSEAWLSRRLSGLAAFCAEDRQRAAAILGYPVEWLFAKPAPPTQREADRSLRFDS